MATRAQKAADIEGLTALLKQAPLTIVAGFTKLKVKDVQQLRRSFRASGANLQVVKNTLARKAAASAGIVGLDPYLKGQTMLAFTGDDAAAPAKALREFSQRFPDVRIVGGAFGGEVMTADRVMRLASLPGRDQMRAELVWALNAPIAGFVHTLNGITGSLVYALQGRLDQLQSPAAN